MIEIDGLKLGILEHLKGADGEVPRRDIVDHVKTLSGKYLDEATQDSLDYLAEEGLIKPLPGLGETMGYVITIEGKKFLRKIRAK